MLYEVITHSMRMQLADQFAGTGLERTLEAPLLVLFYEFLGETIVGIGFIVESDLAIVARNGKAQFGAVGVVV